MQKEWFNLYTTAHIGTIQQLDICLFYDAVWYWKVTDKAHVHVHVVKVYIRKHGTRCRWVVNIMPWLLYPQERTLVPIELEAGGAPELLWAFWTQEKYLATAIIQTPDHPAPLQGWWYSTRSPFFTWLSRRAQSGRWSSFGKRVWFTESNIVFGISFLLVVLFTHFILDIKKACFIKLN
jgi:hypothetical protein